jgi:hypothetical protein
VWLAAGLAIRGCKTARLAVIFARRFPDLRVKLLMDENQAKLDRAHASLQRLVEEAARDGKWGEVTVTVYLEGGTVVRHKEVCGFVNK